MTAAALFFNRKSVEVHDGDTVASALYRSGVRIFSRSFKYHRPRGLLCCAGRCPNCLMNVDGVPNVRTCLTPARDGMQVKHQNADPSLEYDWLSVADRFGWMMPVGWYYKTFTRRWRWRLVEPMIRKVAGLGAIEGSGFPSTSFGYAQDRSLRAGRVQGSTATEYEHLYLHADVAVIGGGRAGIAASIEAARTGETVMMFERESQLGGWLRYQRSSEENLATLSRLTSAVRECPNLQVFTDANCFGLYEGNLLGIVQCTQHSALRREASAGTQHLRERLVHLRARRIIVATGAYEVPFVFENNDLPGVMLSSAAQRLVNAHDIMPGERAVVVSAGEAQIADELTAAGGRVVAVISPDDVIAGVGGRQVTAIRTKNGHIACDLVLMCGPRVPEAGLIAQGGGKLEWDEQHGVFIPKQLPANLSIVGDASGQFVSPTLPVAHSPTRSFVCFCEDVTVKDLRDAIAEGFDHIEMLKRYSTVTMGPCQGKMCQLASIGLCATETGRTMGETGATTARPPTAPVSLGALAGARHHPVKRTPLHYKHEELGAVWMDMGEWKRPLYYCGLQIAECGLNGGESAIRNPQSAIEAEYRAVRERVGLIEVSTLGKLDVKGKDAAKLLDLVYTNRLGNLRVGRVRYSVICDDTGIILDDGTISRLADDHFFVTTTTGNLEFMQQWLEWWSAGTGWCVHVTNVTAGYAAVNVAGPKARDVLNRLTDCDLSNSAFPYMACREAAVAEVPCLLLRIGFVGETGWEIHCPAECGEHVWDAVMEAGREFGIRPFGVEAQRLLRLEKKHVIVGVDTDATSNPLEADMAWVAKLDKDDFIGKAAILRLRQRDATQRLVGFAMHSRVVPEDGAAIVRDGRPIGRVTSARFSPARECVIGLAWVPAAFAKDDQEISIHVNERLMNARIVSEPFYDPAGKELRA